MSGRKSLVKVETNQNQWGGGRGSPLFNSREAAARARVSRGVF